MSYLQGYAPGARIRPILRSVAMAVVFVLSAVDALVSALVGRPSLAGSARRSVSAARRAYLAHRYGPPSECTGLEPHIVEGEIVEEAGR